MSSWDPGDNPYLDPRSCRAIVGGDDETTIHCGNPDTAFCSCGEELCEAHAHVHQYRVGAGLACECPRQHPGLSCAVAEQAEEQLRRDEDDKEFNVIEEVPA